LDLLQGFVSVVDVSGTYATQIYRNAGGGPLSLLHSEVWSTSEGAIECADEIHASETDKWWNTFAPNLETVEDWRHL